MEERTAESLSEFVAHVSQVCDEWREEDERASPWFRGQADARWSLIPRAYRYSRISEDDLRTEFRRRATPLLTDGRPDDVWEWYFLMQHHGIPTRLLDWSEGALLALYFAVRSGLKEDPTRTAAVVWVLDPWWLNEKAMGQNCVLDPTDIASQKYLAEVGVSLILPDLPIAIRPPHVSRRIAAQQSMFTIFGAQQNLVRALPLSDGFESRLAKIVVPATAAPSIAGDLERCGISETMVFPDLEALSRELTDYYALGLVTPHGFRPAGLTSRVASFLPTPVCVAVGRWPCPSGASASSICSMWAGASSPRRLRELVRARSGGHPMIARRWAG